MGKSDDYIPQLSEIEELRRKIVNIKSTAQESLAYIHSELAPQFVYHCNALSGSKISKETTKRIIENGPNDEEADKKFVKEILGLRDAYSKMQELVQGQLNTENITEMHRILHGPIDETTAGILQEDSKVNFQKELRDFAFWFNNNDLDAISFGAEAYSRYIYLHPFKGSNGRMARLIMNLAFMKRKYSSVIIPAKWKKEYEDIMEERNFERFQEFLKKCIYFSQNIVINKKGNLYSENKKRHIRGLNVEDDVLDFVKNNAGCKLILIKQNFPKISFTKLQRLLRAMAIAGKIEFRGPTKIGGYYCI